MVSLTSAFVSSYPIGRTSRGGPASVPDLEPSRGSLARVSARPGRRVSGLAGSGLSCACKRPFARARPVGARRRLPSARPPHRREPMTTSTTNSTKKTEDDLATTVKEIAADVADRTTSAAQRLPEAASATGAQIERASQAMQRESDEVLAVGTSLALGLSLGLLLGGASRLLVLLALIPASMMGYTLFDRHNGVRLTSSTRTH